MQRLAIVGTGLIGASVGLAARASGVTEVRGWDVDADALAVAAQREAVEPTGSLEEAVADAELAIVAAPVAAVPAQVAAVLAASGESTTDPPATPAELASWMSLSVNPLGWAPSRPNSVMTPEVSQRRARVPLLTPFTHLMNEPRLEPLFANTWPVPN